MIETGKKVTEEERLNFMFTCTGLNTCMNFIRKPLTVDMPLEKVEEYYEALMKKFKELKVTEHLQRCELSQKYDVPYEFILRGDDLLIGE